jgi:hypothetical protein
MDGGGELTERLRKARDSLVAQMSSGSTGIGDGRRRCREGGSARSRGRAAPWVVAELPLDGDEEPGARGHGGEAGWARWPRRRELRGVEAFGRRHFSSVGNGEGETEGLGLREASGQHL